MKKVTFTAKFSGRQEQVTISDVKLDDRGFQVLSFTLSTKHGTCDAAEYIENGFPVYGADSCMRNPDMVAELVKLFDLSGFSPYIDRADIIPTDEITKAAWIIYCAERAETSCKLEFIGSGVYVASSATMAREQQSWGDEDESKDVDFTSYPLWITTDNGVDPIGCVDVEDVIAVIL